MSTIPVALPAGATPVTIAWSAPASPTAVVALAHGAGAGMDHPFLAGFADALREAGVACLRFNFPYVEAGRRMPGPAAHAAATWEAVLAETGRQLPGIPAVAAGKSYGGRMASMAASEGRIDPSALVYLGYPLHPPGDPLKVRAAHLPAIAAPQLFVEGSKDPFIQPLTQFDEVVASCRDAEVFWIDGGGHSFEVAGAKRPAAEVGARLAAPVVAWLGRRLSSA
ncbi:hypothetical protein MICABA_00513 [Microbacterium sp. T2.11-28]|nr:hypothetical protein MICABA_00513 [Microbacterium sp. T2.11-28]